MYFWKIESLKKQLANDGLTEVESLKYLIATMLLYSLTAIPTSPIPPYETLNILIASAISVAGIYFVYLSNGGQAGSNIMQRYVSVSFVIFIRYLVFFIPASMVVLIFSATFLTESPFFARLIEIIVTQIFVCIYFWGVAKHVNHVAQAANA